MIPFIMNGNGTISIMLDGSMKPVDTAHRNYEAIKEALKNKEWDVIPGLVNITEYVQKAIAESSVTDGSVIIRNGEVLYNGIPLHNTLAERIVTMAREGFDIAHMVKFLENLMLNPSFRAVNELYGFLEAGSIPITENGTFLAYKKIRSDWKDIHSGTFDNSIGTVCKMPRNRVDENSEQTCSAGLHVCSYNYLPNFGSGSGDRVVICEINPRDVVAIPKDYNDTKMRCCEYKVIGEVKDYRDSNILASKPVVYADVVSNGGVEGTSGTMSSSKDVGKEFSRAIDDNDISLSSAKDLTTLLVQGDIAEEMLTALSTENTKKAGKLLAKAIDLGNVNATKFERRLASMIIESTEDLTDYSDDMDEEARVCDRCGEPLTDGSECGGCGYYND